MIFMVELRAKLAAIVKSMHELFSRKYTPKAIKGKHCNSCSIKEICLPNLGKQERTFVKEYMEAHLK